MRGGVGIWLRVKHIYLYLVKVGTCLSSDTLFLLVNAPGKDSEALQRLARIGYTNVSFVYAQYTSCFFFFFFFCILCIQWNSSIPTP